MKGIVLSLAGVILLALQLFSQQVYIPDHKFLNALIEQGVDSNRDGKIDHEEAKDLKVLNVKQKGIKDLTGIKAFVNLTELDCGNIHWPARADINKISSLDVSGLVALKRLYCTKSGIGSLNLSGCTALETLFCDYNELSSLDVSTCQSLLYLKCERNRLRRLDISDHPALIQVCCFKNQISHLNASGAKALQKLYCQFNEIKKLDLTECASLVHLACTRNQLSSLDLSDCTALDYLDCQYNELSSLDVSGHSVLRRLRCSENPIDKLDVSGCRVLGLLYCENNRLSQLDVSDCDSLRYLACSLNSLSSLDVSNNPELLWLVCYKSGLPCLELSNNTLLSILACGGNQLSYLDISNNPNLSYLNIREMSCLKQVCVAKLPFPSENVRVYMDGCQDSVFTAVCPDYKAPCILAEDIVYQPDNIEFTSSEDGVVYLVPEKTENQVGCIYGSCIDSVVVYANSSAKISSSGLDEGIYWLYARDAAGNISEPKIVTLIGVGIQQNSSDPIRIYPNPTENILTIETSFPDHYSISIISMIGQEIYHGSMEGSLHHIDFSPFQEGIYFFTIRSKNYKKTEKIIKL